ncbi:MAG: glycosyltransferase, partial [Sphingomonadaceae bacterium]
MAGADPLLSILMVNWNTRAMTLACLRSIYVQTERTPFEIILVDNGSTDGSANAIVHDFPAVRLLAEDKNHGFAHANNLAAAQARGQYLLLLNTDTLVLDQAIDRLVDFAQ